MEELHEQRKSAMAAVVEILTKGMTPATTLTKLGELAADESHVTSAVEFAERAEDATLSSPFVDHMAIYRQIDALYTTIASEKKTYRKLAYKKYHALADDKKADPVLLAEATANKDDVDADFAKLNVKMIQIKLVLGPPAAEGEEAKTL